MGDFLTQRGLAMGLMHYNRECLSERVYDGEGPNLPPGSRLQYPKQGTDREVWKVRLLQLLRNLLTIRNHRLPPWWAANSRMPLLPYRLRNRWCLRLPYHPGFLKENEEEMVLGKIRKIALTPKFIPIFRITIPKNILNFGIRAIFQRFHLSSSPYLMGAVSVL